MMYPHIQVFSLFASASNEANRLQYTQGSFIRSRQVAPPTQFFTQYLATPLGGWLCEAHLHRYMEQLCTNENPRLEFVKIRGPLLRRRRGSNPRLRLFQPQVARAPRNH